MNPFRTLLSLGLAGLLLACIVTQLVVVPTLTRELITVWDFPVPLAVSAAAGGILALVCAEVILVLATRLALRPHADFGPHLTRALQHMRIAAIVATFLTALSSLALLAFGPAHHLGVSAVLACAVLIPGTFVLVMIAVERYVARALATAAELEGVI